MVKIRERDYDRKECRQMMSRGGETQGNRGNQGGMGLETRKIDRKGLGE